jgi:pyrroloquinoline quinone (PQQ) biosynthesis protein C
MIAQAFCRSVPFLIDSGFSDEQPRIMLDRALLNMTDNLEPHFAAKVVASLNLSSIAATLPEQVCAELIGEQYQVCLEYIYSHPVWASFRAGEGKDAILAYLLETRHYLHAAASRMAPGVAAGWRDGPLLRLLASHVVEEADHAKFFDESLSVIGCTPELVGGLRPSPISLEWICLMRSLAARGPLIAAVCSGLMESSAADHANVEGWHEMIVQNDLLPKTAVDAIYQHVRTDIELGHGQNWVDALKLQAPLTSDELRDCLNSVCSVAEMIYRWLSHLVDGVSGPLVRCLSSVETPALAGQSILDPIFDGTPVWPAEITHSICHGSELSDGARTVLALAYHLPCGARVVDGPVGQASKSLQDSFASETNVCGSVEDLQALLKGWLRTIDGHRLWSELVDSPSPSLIHGWVLENYFYFSSAARHVSAAVASCPDPLIRTELVLHLQEETDHADLLKEGLADGSESASIVTVDLCRPLPTTLAFIGYLRETASLDWKAYCLALAYIQLSLRPQDEKYQLFFEALDARTPEASRIWRGILAHDLADKALGHSTDSQKLLTLLYERHPLEISSIKRAATLASLSWSFLDGIRCQYRNGSMSLFQRLGWSSRGLA